jgi:hypothetical protein
MVSLLAVAETLAKNSVCAEASLSLLVGSTAPQAVICAGRNLLMALIRKWKGVDKKFVIPDRSTLGRVPGFFTETGETLGATGKSITCSETP